MNRQSSEKLINMPLDELIALANRARRDGVGTSIETCGIVNAKSGLCGEDCRFCAQSARHKTGVKTYPLIDENALVDAARKSRNDGAIRFGIVTSGNRPDKNDIKTICRAVQRIAEEAGIMPCASLGAIDEEDFAELKASGLTRYHHNIETSENYYTKIVTTHAYTERIRTIKAAKNAGLEVCSGGILGLGESWNDRLDMAFSLKELDVDAVPINFLVPIKGTPLGETKQIAAVDAIRAIAVFRIILKDKTIKVAAGRETVLKDFQGMMYAAGANGMMVGGYLTVAGRSAEEDKALISEIKKLWNG